MNPVELKRRKTYGNRTHTKTCPLVCPCRSATLLRDNGFMTQRLKMGAFELEDYQQNTYSDYT